MTFDSLEGRSAAEIQASADSDTKERLYDERCGRSDLPSLEVWPFSSSSSDPEPPKSEELGLRFNIARRWCRELVVVSSLFGEAKRVAEELA